MLIAKVSAVAAAVLFMSSVSAQAMEFADRPGPISETFVSALTVRAIQSEERLRRQINHHNIFLSVSGAWIKLGDRPRAISNVRRVWVQTTFQNRPGRLSVEFSAVAKSSRIKFEYGPGEVSGWLKPNTAHVAMKIADHPGPIGTLFPPLGTENIQLADSTFTSSILKIIIRPGMRPRPASVGFCVGSMAPCGSLNFAQPSRMGSFSAAYHDGLL